MIASLAPGLKGYIIILFTHATEPKWLCKHITCHYQKITTRLLPDCPAQYLNYPLCQARKKSGPKENQGKDWLSRQECLWKLSFVMKVLLKYMRNFKNAYIIPIFQHVSHLFGVLSNFYPHGHIVKFIKLYILYVYKFYISCNIILETLSLDFTFISSIFLLHPIGYVYIYLIIFLILDASAVS